MRYSSPSVLSRTLGGAALFLGLASPVFALAARGKPAPLSYERHVLPLFQARCVSCHGAGNAEAGLDLRTRGDLRQGGYSGSPVVPGAPEKSLLYQMLADGRMPKGKRLEPAELKRVADWIRAGAAGTTGAGGHWAFRAPRKVAPPKVRAEERVRNPIDQFLLARLEQKGLTFSPEADRRTLIRRVTFDLIGLPPTPEEVDAFVRDDGPEAYEKLVDRLLADPRYGERWARHWLDTAGYADSEGVLQEDRIRPNAWRYRDYVIRALNADKPYDQFLREQIAADEILDYKNIRQWTPDVIDTLAATGFLRTAVDATRDDFNPHQYGEYQYRMLHDTQTILLSTTMALTVQCSRCHDHKYEPFTQKDYFRLQALLTGAVRPRGTLLPTNRRQIVAATPEEQETAKKVNAAVDAALARLKEDQQALLLRFQIRHAEANVEKVPPSERGAFLAAVKTTEARRTPEEKALLARHSGLAAAGPDVLSAAFPEFREGLQAVQQARQAEEKKRITHTEIRAFYDQDGSPPPTPLLVRGEWLRPGDPVEPGVLAPLDDPRKPFAVPAPPTGAYTTGRRKAFAEWLTRPDHPLTARVMVNRVWAQHFGAGIVASVENFGRSGARPTHPELLDYLASVFSASPADRETEGRSEGAKGKRSLSLSVSPSLHPEGLGWSLKKLHRLIVTSSAYRQSSSLGSKKPAGAGTNPQSAIRNPQSIDPENRLLWRQRARRPEAEAVRDAMLAATGTLDPAMFGEPVGNEVRGTGEVVPVGEEKGGRRSIYILVRRSMPVTLLNSFDQPVMETNCTRRSPSTTATQALALMNSSFVSSQAGHFARRVLKEASTDPARVSRAYQLALGRSPTPLELSTTLTFLGEQAALYRQQPGKAAEQTMELAWADFCQALLSSNEFVYVD